MAHFFCILFHTMTFLPRTRSASGVKWSVVVSIYIIYICLWTKKIFESHFRDWLTFSNIRSRTSRQIYRLALPLRTPEMLSSLSKSRISIFNAHFTLFVRRMTSHNSIGKYRHLVNWLGTCLGTERHHLQTRLVECRTGKKVNVWSSTVYSCDFHEGRQHFITLLMFVLNFVLFFNLFTLVIFMKVDNISSHR